MARRPAPKKGGPGLEACQGCKGEAQKGRQQGEEEAEGKEAAGKEEAEGKEVKETENMLLGMIRIVENDIE